MYVGFGDGTFRLYQAESGALLAKFGGHRSAIHQISTHGDNLLTVSVTEAILWSVDQRKKIRILSGADYVGVDHAMFSPNGTNLITLFRDDHVAIWDVESFKCLYKLSVFPSVPDANPVDTDSIHLAEVIDAPAGIIDLTMKNRCSFSLDAQIMAIATTKFPVIAVWNWNEQSLIQEIQIPGFGEIEDEDSKTLPITRIQFIGATKLLCVLSSTGRMIIVDALLGKMVYRMPQALHVKLFTLSPEGNNMALLIKEDKSTIKFLSMESLLKEKNIISHPTVTLRSKLREKEKEERKHVTLLDLVKLNDHERQINRAKLRNYLKNFGEYPATYRLLIWRFMLRLPENRHAFQTLCERGIHPAFQNLSRTYPVKSYKLLRSMERLLSAFAHWSPIFSELDYFPSFVFPFLHLFKGSYDTFTCFEVIVTVIMNWCQHWFEYFPNPPLQILNLIEDLLIHHDIQLFDAFKDNKITAQIYAWPLLQCLFSAHFTTENWFTIMDHIISEPPDFLLYLVVSYLKYHRDALIRFNEIKDFKAFFNHSSPCNVATIIRVAHSLKEKTPKNLIPDPKLIQPFKPIAKSETVYPMFQEYPEYIVNYQRKIKDRIRQEELDFIRKKKIMDDIQELEQDLRIDEKRYMEHEKNITNVLNDWWGGIIEEEQKHSDEKLKLNTLEHEKRTQLLQRIRDTRQKFLEQSQLKYQRQRNMKQKLHHVQDMIFDDELVDKYEEDALENVESRWFERVNKH